jgi:hypothetical protein
LRLPAPVSEAHGSRPIRRNFAPNTSPDPTGHLQEPVLEIVCYPMIVLQSRRRLQFTRRPTKTSDKRNEPLSTQRRRNHSLLHPDHRVNSKSVRSDANSGMHAMPAYVCIILRTFVPAWVRTNIGWKLIFIDVKTQ